MAKISNVTARTFCAHINNSLVYSLITLCFHSSLLMGQSCLPSCIFFFTSKASKESSQRSCPVSTSWDGPCCCLRRHWRLAHSNQSSALAFPALTYPQLVLTTIQQLMQLLPEAIGAHMFSAVFSNCLSASLLSIQC